MRARAAQAKSVAGKHACAYLLSGHGAWAMRHLYELLGHGRPVGALARAVHVLLQVSAQVLKDLRCRAAAVSAGVSCRAARTRALSQPGSRSPIRSKAGAHQVKDRLSMLLHVLHAQQPAFPRHCDNSSLTTGQSCTPEHFACTHRRFTGLAQQAALPWATGIYTPITCPAPLARAPYEGLKVKATPP